MCATADVVQFRTHARTLARRCDVQNINAKYVIGIEMTAGVHERGVNSCTAPALVVSVCFDVIFSDFLSTATKMLRMANRDNVCVCFCVCDS